MSDERIIVVGGGPVGLTAAWALARQQIPVTVLEANSHSQTDWRASTFHAATMELLDGIDVAEEMLAEGLRVPRYQYRDRRTGVVAEFDMSSLSDVTRFPFRLQLNQQRLVAMLHRRLAESPFADVRFEHQVIGVTGDEHSTELRVRTPGGEVLLPADFVLAADGAASGVRKALGVSFEGVTYDDRYLIISLNEDLGESRADDFADVCYISDPDEFVFVLRTPESWRILFPIPADESLEAALEPQAMQRRLRTFHDLGRAYSIIDQQIYSVHQRVAGTFCVGRVVLLGDAAHINSPMGGMGLNSGIHDAFDVTRRLIRILKEDVAPSPELARYAEVRRQVAVDYVRTDTERNTQIMKEKAPAVRSANQAALRATAADPVKAREWMLRASLLSAVADQGIGQAPDETSNVTDLGTGETYAARNL